MSIAEHDIETLSSEITAEDNTEVNATDAQTVEAEAVKPEPALEAAAAKVDDAPAESEPAVKTKEAAAEAKPSKNEPAPENASRRLSISVRTLVLATVVCVLVAGVCALGWLYIRAENKLSAQARAASNNKHAQEIALDYAVHAAEMNYQDLNTWKTDLVKHTSPELKDKLTKAANDMEQILTPLQWNSTARPLAAIVRSDAGGTYTVDSFISVLTKTVQAPEGLQSTATYSLTIDSNKDWQISDVGGIDAALGSK
jgi:Mce-associated membrane protein